MLYVVVALEPMRKLRYVRFAFNRLMDSDMVTAMMSNVRFALVRLYNWFMKHAAVIVAHGNNGGVNVHVEEMRVGPDAFKQAFLMEMRNENTCASSSSELEKYLDDSNLVADSKFDILGWWKLKAGKYPVLSKVARVVLVVPVTMVASESIFSTGGRILDAFQRSLSPATVEGLICTQNWLKTDATSIDVKAGMDMVAVIEELGNSTWSIWTDLNSIRISGSDYFILYRNTHKILTLVAELEDCQAWESYEVN